MELPRESGDTRTRSRTDTGPDPVADRMLDVAVARIAAEGMSVGLDRIRMEQVIDEAGVSRATAYRRWPSREQFLADVLVETVRRTSLIPETEQDVVRLLALVAEHRDRLGSAQGRRDLIVEGLRASMDADVRRVLASPRSRTFVSLSATYQGLPAGHVRDAVGSALVSAEAAFAERRAEVYANLARLIGYRLVAPLVGADGFRVLAGASGAMMTGILLRAIVRPGWLDERTPAQLFGQSRATAWSEPERWGVGLMLTYLEPDPHLRWDEATVERMLADFEGQVRVFLTPSPEAT